MKTLKNIALVVLVLVIIGVLFFVGAHFLSDSKGSVTTNATTTPPATFFEPASPTPLPTPATGTIEPSAPDPAAPVPTHDEVAKELDQKTALQQKLNSIILPSVEFDHVKLSEVVAFLKAESKKNDPTGEGVDFQYQIPEGATEPNCTISLQQSSLVVILALLEKDSNVETSIEGNSVFLRLH